MDKHILVQSISVYDFQDKVTGEQRTGISFEYVNIEKVDEIDKIGHFTKKGKLDLTQENRKKFKSIPGIYNGVYDIDMSKKKPELKLVDIQYLAPVEYKFELSK